VLSSSLNAGLVAFWPFDSSAEDVVGGYDGIPNGGVDFGEDGATANTGSSALFDQGGVDVELSEDLNPESYTFVAWAKTFAVDGNPYSVVTSREDLGPGVELYGYILYQINGVWSHWTGDGDLGCGDGDCWDILDGDPVEVDEWQHLAISFDAEESIKSLYIDGMLVAEAEQEYVPNTTQDLHIGSGSQLGDTFRFVGQIDDVALFDTALTEAEIAAIMDNGVASLLDSLPGDFDGNGALDGADIDQLTSESANQTNAAAFDLNGDNLANELDIHVWAKDLKQTWIGDADLSGEFNSSDLVATLAAGTYEVDVNAVWSTGDFNGDGRFNSSDLVAALADGGYEQGPRAAVSAVPEPSSSMLSILAALAAVKWSRRSRLGWLQP
jgi:hypothetical protein